MGGILVALGGNALHRAGGDGSWREAQARMHATAAPLAELAAEVQELVITHGNGPQIGSLLRQNERASSEVPPRPMDVLGAETQGQIGYLIQSALDPALRRLKVDRTVLTIVSRTEVSPRDPAFRRPTKPVGRFFSEEEARVYRKRFGWSMGLDAARGGWRRLVPSPRPLRWLEAPVVREMLRSGRARRWIPVVTGGGGIPVVQRKGGAYEGVEAVVDKDLTASLVARELRLDTLAIVTDVPGAAAAFGRHGERWLGSVRREELEQLYARGEFAEGSMGPKIEAGLDFLRQGGRQFIVTEIPSLARALRGEAGTRVR